MIRKHLAESQEWLAKLEMGFSDTVDHILNSLPDAQSKGNALRELIAKHAPCPVEGAKWTLVNSFDYDFEGFASSNLTAHANRLSAAKNPADVAGIPNLLVLRDLGLAAKLAYEEESVIKYFCQKWNMTSQFLNFHAQGIAAFIMQDQQNIVLSFRGTEMLDLKEWSIDFRVAFVPMTAHASDGASSGKSAKKPLVLAHSGFLTALGLQVSSEANSPFEKIYGILVQMLAKAPRKLWITGHSLGASLSSIFTAQLVLDADTALLSNLAGVYTYGQPRCGNEEYIKLFVDLEKRGLVIRAVNKKDVVTTVPTKVLAYRHHGCKIDIISDTSLMFWYNGDTVKIARVAVHGEKKDPQKSYALKKVVLLLMPDSVEDHYPSHYVRNIELFLHAQQKV